MTQNEQTQVLDEKLMFTGTQVNYYFVCKRKLWLFSHGLELESESDLVRLGRLLHEHSYKRKFKEVQIDRIKVDFFESEKGESATKDSEEAKRTDLGIGIGNANGAVVVHEVKRSRSMHDAHTFQLLYYIYHLKRNYGVNVTKGILHYPLLKTNIQVELTEEREKQLECILSEISRILSFASPPVQIWVKACRACAYRELCWG